MMCFVFKLSKFILVPILFEWLDLRDYVIFDSSVNRKQFQLLLALLREFNNKFQSDVLRHDPIPICLSSIMWLNRRCISVNNVVITNKSFDLLNVIEQSYLTTLWERLFPAEDNSMNRSIVYKYLNKVRCLSVCDTITNALKYQTY